MALPQSHYDYIDALKVAADRFARHDGDDFEADDDLRAEVAARLEQTGIVKAEDSSDYGRLATLLLAAVGIGIFAERYKDQVSTPDVADSDGD